MVSSSPEAVILPNVVLAGAEVIVPRSLDDVVSTGPEIAVKAREEC